ncbi:hypothetical protein JAAARDRAFT_30425 [Jaapia argillacea MUCL 33604]|uniref:Cyclopropane-fatty-acyl-phospholipid synthase n=1 Tax=Jaapia argillacea MUCL 33604 TaxID=933084 RepID=A0A067QG91_9AGAM|nr:hypothetical protein JAAARDRAFT_30425 [Jaapia argillacea MUCL 33604]
MSDLLLDTPSKHSLSLAGLADSAWTTLREAAFKTGWKPISRLAEAAVVALMQNITTGQLRVLTYDHIYTFPAPGSKQEAENPMPDLKAELRVVDDVFWIRLCTMSDLGFAEAYMYGDVECDDLVSIFLLFLYNKDNLSNMSSKASYFFSIPQKLTSYRFVNSIGNSRSNISAHYDISNEMFKGFLSRDMTYSCAIFDDLDGDLKELSGEKGAWSGGQHLTRVSHPAPLTPPTTSASSSSVSSTNSSEQLHNDAHFLPPFPQSHPDPLYAGQLRKLNHILSRARVQPGYKILEIGSGWGSLSLLVARTVPGVEIHTITLSTYQRQYVLDLLRRSAESQSTGHGDDGFAPLAEGSSVHVHLMDYRDIKKKEEWKGYFDRVVSVEMVEAVGGEFLEEYWSVIDWALNLRTGVGVIQGITLPEARFETYKSEIDFIRKWVFPGGFLPTLTLLLETLNKGSKGKLVVDSVSNIGPHYARTLRHWRQAFLQKFDSVIVPALVKEYPDVMGGKNGAQEVEVFKRKWIYYFCYCEVGFTTRTLGDHIVTFVREGNEDYGCQVFE